MYETLSRYPDPPRDIICSMACFRLRSHTLRIEAVSCTRNTFPTCDLCNANDVQDEQRVLFHYNHPHVVSLLRTDASLFPPAGFDNVFGALGQKNDKLYFFLHAVKRFLSRLAATLLDRRPFSWKPLALKKIVPYVYPKHSCLCSFQNFVSVYFAPH